MCVPNAIVTVAPPTAWRFSECVETGEESSFNCGAERKASDGFAEAGAPVWTLLWTGQQNQPHKDTFPRQAHWHGCQSAGGLPKPQGTFSTCVRACVWRIQSCQSCKKKQCHCCAFLKRCFSFNTERLTVIKKKKKRCSWIWLTHRMPRRIVSDCRESGARQLFAGKPFLKFPYSAAAAAAAATVCLLV